MSRIILGLICGLAFGTLSAASTTPFKFLEKRAAPLGAILTRFGTGCVKALERLPLPGWAIGALAGLLLSLPDAIVTEIYVPILGVGIVGGAIIGAMDDEKRARAAHTETVDRASPSQSVIYEK